MKKLVYLPISLLFFNALLIKCQTNSTLVEYIKSEKFNLLVYELAFAIDEVVYILESDTSSKQLLENRMERFHNNNLSKETNYIRSIEIRIFNDNLKPYQKYDSISDTYLLLSRYVSNRLLDSSIYKEYTEIFRSYIKYPSQVDDICLITLIHFNDKILEEIQNNKYTLYHFNNWLEYGYEEFRINASNKAEMEINKRISDFIINKYKDSTNDLARRTIIMFKRFIQ